MRKWVVAIVAVALVLLGCLLPLLMPWHCPVNRAAYERIKNGMTQAEVYAIMGGPPGDYLTHPVNQIQTDPDLTNSGSLDDSEASLDVWVGVQPEWVGDEGIVSVRFKPDGTVDASRFDEWENLEPVSLAELICWRLEKLKECWMAIAAPK